MIARLDSHFQRYNTFLLRPRGRPDLVNRRVQPSRTWTSRCAKRTAGGNGCDEARCASSERPSKYPPCAFPVPLYTTGDERSPPIPLAACPCQLSQGSGRRGQLPPTQGNGAPAQVDAFVDLDWMEAAEPYGSIVFGHAHSPPSPGDRPGRPPRLFGRRPVEVIESAAYFNTVIARRPHPVAPDRWSFDAGQVRTYGKTHADVRLLTPRPTAYRPCSGRLPARWLLCGQDG